MTLKPRQAVKLALGIPLLLFATLLAGTAWHEVVGHGLTGVLCGGRITHVDILGVQVWPRLRWTGWPTAYGHCLVRGIPTSTGRLVMQLGGSLSTWLISAGAVTLLWARRWRGWRRVVLVCLGIWWVDLFTYTLPSWFFYDMIS